MTKVAIALVIEMDAENPCFHCATAALATELQKAGLITRPEDMMGSMLMFLFQFASACPLPSMREQCLKFINDGAARFTEMINAGTFEANIDMLHSHLEGTRQ